MRVALSVSLVALAACSVGEIDLEGRPCPCVDGYRCDTASNLCVRDADGGPGMDGGVRVDGGSRIDGGGTGTDAGMPADGGGTDRDGGVPPTDGGMPPADGGCWRDEFDDGSLTGWTTGGTGTWVEMSSAFSQTDDTAGLAYAYALPTAGSGNVRVRLRMEQISGGSGNAMEIIFRVAGGSSLAMYFCNWEPNSRRMILMRQSASGSTYSLEELTISPGGRYDPFGPATMVLEARGDAFYCYLEEYSGTAITAGDGMFASGYVGIKTYLMAGAFDWIEVCPLP